MANFAYVSFSGVKSSIRPLINLGSAIALCLVLAKAAPLSAQNPTGTLVGTLVDEAGQTLIGATVLARPGLQGTSADVDGRWTLTAPDADSLQFSYVGYGTRTIAVGALPADGRVVLGGSQALDEIVVAARKSGTFTSVLDPRHVETITSHELKKAPCCNLGESFETNAAVDVSYRDAATGAREMQVLGLRGIYSQLLIEKRPTLYGLAAPIALDLIAGTWLESIQIGKGAASVQTGPNALAGQINTELVKPSTSDPLFVNLFGAGTGRFEANVHTMHKWDDRQSTGLLLHGSQNLQSMDRDRDGFYEQPGRRTLSGMARHFVSTDKWAGQVNVWGVTDRREGGQTDHAATDLQGHAHGEERYVITQANDRVEAFAKTAYLGFARALTSIGVIGGATYHKLDNAYGPTRHLADQRSGYLSTLYTSYLGNTAHTYTVGGTVQVDDYDERLSDVTYDRTERVAGAFAEYTYERPLADGPNRRAVGLSVIGGLRVDHHSLGGWQALPRVNVKVSPGGNTALRASVGRAYRSAQVIAENIRLLPSSRNFLLEEPLRLETGWNYGLAVTHNIGEPGTERNFRPNAQLGLDLYATQFDNIATVDQETTLGFTRVANAPAPARTYSALASLNLELLQGFGVKLAYKYVDSRQTYLDGVERQVPYVAHFRGLLASDYETPSKRWRFNGNVQWVGPQRLPGQDAFVAVDVAPAQPLVFTSPSFVLVNVQATYVFNDFLEVYAGAENLTDYRQRHAILGAENPAQAVYFDASRVYAPLVGRMPYAGLRYTLNKD